MKKITVGTTLVLPGVEMVLGILERTEYFAMQEGNELFQRMLELKTPKGRVKGINRITVAELLTALYLDQLHNYCKWTPMSGADQYYEDQIQVMVEGWTGLGTSHQNAFYQEVVQPAYEEVHDWVNRFEDNEDSWHIWYVRRLGLDVIVEKGPDYRIVDWERRMQLAADHQKMVEEGETLPEGAWVADGEAKRFIELLMRQQKQPTPLGKSVVDELDKQRRAMSRTGRRARGRTRSL